MLNKYLKNYGVLLLICWHSKCILSSKEVGCKSILKYSINFEWMVR